MFMWSFGALKEAKGSETSFSKASCAFLAFLGWGPSLDGGRVGGEALIHNCGILAEQLPRLVMSP